MTATEPARFDLAKLVEQSRPTTVQTVGIRNGQENPFVHKVRESFKADEAAKDSGWQELPMPARMIDDVIGSLRALSTWFGKEREGIGVHIRIEYQPDGQDGTIEVGPQDFAEIPRDDREVYLKYTGRKRLNRGRKKNAEAQQAATGSPGHEESDADAATELEDDES
jgi:hypothetical protein